MISKEEIWTVLEEIPDPEIPVISINELGVLREIKKEPSGFVITITPTYSGCPAMNQIETDIKNKLAELGVKKYSINLQYHPAWTTDWMSAEAKDKLLEYGISPPNKSVDKSALLGVKKTPICPKCKSLNTKMISQFGSTACKALYQCNECLEPYDYFKCI